MYCEKAKSAKSVGFKSKIAISSTEAQTKTSKQVNVKFFPAEPNVLKGTIYCSVIEAILNVIFPHLERIHWAQETL